MWRVVVSEEGVEGPGRVWLLCGLLGSASQVCPQGANCALGPDGEVGPAAMQTCGSAVVRGLTIVGVQFL